MSEEVIMEVSGVNGQVKLFSEKIVISRKGFMAKLSQGLTKGDKEIPIDQITGIQFKEPGFITNGYIQFGQSGYSESDGGVFDATSDENSINFNSGSEDEFKRLKEKINELRSGNGQRGSEEDSALQRLKEKFVEGEISEEEYKRKKEVLEE